MKTVLTFGLVLAFLSSRGQEFVSYEQTLPGSNIKFNMVAIESGSFLMGSTGSEKGRNEDEGPPRKVKLSPFWIARHEVTFEEWDVFFKNVSIQQAKNITADAVSRPTAQYIDLTWGMGRDSKHPSNSMSQQAALMYCKWLYEKTGIFFRLPTEAEWEYACKAGNWSLQKSNLPAGYFKENSGGKFHKVEELKPNAWGLFDMLGNLSEWTLDQYDPEMLKKIKDNTLDPVTPPASRYPKVVKGGSFMDDATELRCANRIPSDASWNKRDPQIPKSKWWLTDGMFAGFRIVRPATQPSKEDIEKFFTEYLK